MSRPVLERSVSFPGVRFVGYKSAPHKSSIKRALRVLACAVDSVLAEQVARKKRLYAQDAGPVAYPAETSTRAFWNRQGRVPGDGVSEHAL